MLWSGLDIIDETYLREEIDREAKKWEALKQAKNVVQMLSPRGNLKYVSYEYVGDGGVRIHASEGLPQVGREALIIF